MKMLDIFNVWPSKTISNTRIPMRNIPYLKQGNVHFSKISVLWGFFLPFLLHVYKNLDSFYLSSNLIQSLLPLSLSSGKEQKSL